MMIERILVHDVAHALDLHLEPDPAPDLEGELGVDRGLSLLALAPGAPERYAS